MPSYFTSSGPRLVGEITDADFEEFKTICSKRGSLEYQYAESVVNEIPIYRGSALKKLIRAHHEPDSVDNVGNMARDSIMQEIQSAISEGPGFLVIRQMFSQEVIDGAEKVTSIVRDPKNGYVAKQESGRTFSYSEKHATCDPENFADYYGNEILAMICEAWLGPGYQITAMTNAITTDGAKQDIHRDYPLSSQPDARRSRYPLANQITSQLLTLQCAIAHTDMPFSTGPTRFLRGSQRYGKGYMAFKDPRFVEWTDKNMVQMELSKGDAVFFNPAIFHQPGLNTLDTPRVANLLQVNVCWGRPMEANDRVKMTKSVWPVMKQWHAEVHGEAKEAGANGHANGHANGVNGHAEKGRHPLELDALIKATSDEYGYPIRIDIVDGQGSQGNIVRKALKEGWTDEQFYKALDAHETTHC